MGTVHHIELYGKDGNLSDLVDPCTKCKQRLTCIETCDRASTWWDKVASNFKRRSVIRKLGGE